MKTSLPPLTWFRSFEAAARTLSSTAAAAEIGLTQSAVSQQIRALESRFGVTLFRRHARGLSLTDEGRKLLPKVESALETLQAATQSYIVPKDEAQLSIAASVSVIDWLIAPALPEFQRKFPNLKIRLLGTIWPDEFSAPKADVEIRFGSLKQVGKGAIALAPNGLVALQSPKLLGDIETLPLIETVGTSSGWAAWGHAAGVELQNPSLFADSYGLALRLASHANGVALVSSFIASHALRTGRLIQAHPTEIPANEGYFLATRNGSFYGEEFSRWVSEKAGHASVLGHKIADEGG